MHFSDQGFENMPDFSITQWDFKEYPYALPLYLFKAFQKRFCRTNETHGVHVDFFDFTLLVSHCQTVAFLPPEYDLWIHLNRVWETAFSFSFQVFEKGYKPYEEFSARHKKAEIGIGVYSYAGGELKIEPFKHCKESSNIRLILLEDHLFNEIKKEIEKTSLHFTD